MFLLSCIIFLTFRFILFDRFISLALTYCSFYHFIHSIPTLLRSIKSYILLQTILLMYFLFFLYMITNIYYRYDVYMIINIYTYIYYVYYHSLWKMKSLQYNKLVYYSKYIILYNLIYIICNNIYYIF